MCFPKIFRIMPLAATCCLLLVLIPAFAQTNGTKIDSQRLEVIEDLSESLANDLLELSIATHGRDLNKTREFFPDELTAQVFPTEPLPIKNQVKWIGNHGWRPSATGRISNEAFLQSFAKFLEHFTEIEDARFKVKEAAFDENAQADLSAEQPTAIVGAKGSGRIAFYVIGRDRDGKREWARGSLLVKVRFDKTNRWQFDSLEIQSIESMVAGEDIFSEVAVPAGVGLNIGSYGSAENPGGFVWHGAAAADFNADGWIDLFVTSASRNYLYLNDKKGGFRDASAETGVLLLATGTAPLVLDYDNDGDSDVFITAVGQQILLENRLKQDGRLEFYDVSLESGVAKNATAFSAVTGDVNGDGFLDIYVTSYNRYGQVTPDSWFRATNGTTNLLLINKGDGTFSEEAAAWGVEDKRWSYAAEFADVNADGKIDLYVANDFGEKALFINHGDKFVDEARERGVLDPGNGMGVSFGDYNNDGLLDLHATNMSSTAGNRILSRLFPNATAQDNVLKKLAAGNNLYENTGDGKFKDVTAEVGGFSGGWAWGGGFIDFDNDGWEDIYTPNGFISGKSMKDT